MKKITLVDGDDWVGLYIDGKLVYEGHDYGGDGNLLIMVDVDHDFLYCDSEWLGERGNFPEDLSDVKFGE